MIVTEKFPSSSSSSVYLAQYDTETGGVECTCRGYYIVKKDKVTGQDRPKECTHTKQMVAKHGVAPTGVVAMVTKSETDDCPEKPMLASSMAEVGGRFEDYCGDPNWAMEEKLDGHRITVKVDDEITAWARPKTGPAKRRKLPPHIIAELRDVSHGLYNAELRVPGGVSTDVVRLALQSKLELILFDVTSVGNVDCSVLPYNKRRQVLLASAPNCGAQTGRYVRVIESTPVSEERLSDIWNAGGEGAILKRVSSVYQAGRRSEDWIKAKRSGSEAMTVTGFKAGENGPYSTVTLMSSDGLATAVKTKNNAWLKKLAKNPQSYVGRRLVVSYIEKTASGKLRHGMWDHFEGEGD